MGANARRTTAREHGREFLAAVAGARRERTIHLVGLSLGVALLLAGWAFAESQGVSGNYLTREPQIVLQGKYYAGVLSNVGAVLWTIAAVVAAIGWVTASDRAERKMFLLGAVLGTVLLFDDFFLFHDALGDQISEAAERVWIAGYLLAVLWLIKAHWRTMGSVALAGVLVTVGFLSVSVLLDTFFNDLPQLIEDGAKLLGIITWLVTWTLRVRPWELERRLT